jgi:hypothetical protein
MLAAVAAALITDKQQELLQVVAVLAVIRRQVLTALRQLQIQAEVVVVLELREQTTLELAALVVKV